MKRQVWRVAATLTAALALLAGVATDAGAARSGSERATATIKVGIIYSRTGALAAYGAQYISGLRWGLNYVTKGTRRINGRSAGVSTLPTV